VTRRDATRGAVPSFTRLASIEKTKQTRIHPYLVDGYDLATIENISFFFLCRKWDGLGTERNDV